MRTIPTRVGRTAQSGIEQHKTADHPHAGGENVFHYGRNQLRHGPSPRGWGEHGHGRHDLAGVRTIPTRVGRTDLPPLCFRAPADHPHAGGENGICLKYRIAANGPSPRGWGELEHNLAEFNERRTIPTRVGRTLCDRLGTYGVSDHPHAGGENKLTLLTHSTTSWTIPTRVGRTASSNRIGVSTPDHPHACGEICSVFIGSLILIGPSPRGWGEL